MLIGIITYYNEMMPFFNSPSWRNLILTVFLFFLEHCGKSVFISGPIPTVGHSTSVSRHLSLNDWLQPSCRSLGFIDNFNLFWDQLSLFKKLTSPNWDLAEEHGVSPPNRTVPTGLLNQWLDCFFMLLLLMFHCYFFNLRFLSSIFRNFTLLKHFVTLLFERCNIK